MPPRELQSTLPHGERQVYSHFLHIMTVLQSTLPHGERRMVSQGIAFRWNASIHAPARGATSTNTETPTNAKLQSTLPHGERPCKAMRCAYGVELQSTLPHGERRSSYVAVVDRASFNPRSRTGSDDVYPFCTIFGIRLQSTLPHGERPAPENVGGNCGVLQSTLPHGERLNSLAVNAAGFRFNPRSRTGSDLCSVDHAASYAKLQSTLPHGERLWPFFTFAPQ